jgi:hypothetical protein
MAIKKLERDLAFISKLSDYPGSQDGLSTDEFKAMFDAGPMAIQEYINDELVPAINAIAPGEDDGGIYLPLAGGKMKGVLDMGGQRLKNLPAPVDDEDAVPKSYVLPKTGGSMFGDIDMSGYKVKGLSIPTESGDAASKEYVDSRRFSTQVNVPASGWAVVGGVYSQTILVAGVLGTDEPHYGVVYSGNAADRVAQKEAFALVDDLDTGSGIITLSCFGDAPGIDLVLQLEVNR